MEFSEDEKLSRRQDFALEQSIIDFGNIFQYFLKPLDYKCLNFII